MLFGWRESWPPIFKTVKWSAVVANYVCPKVFANRKIFVKYVCPQMCPPKTQEIMCEPANWSILYPKKCYLSGTLLLSPNTAPRTTSWPSVSVHAGCLSVLARSVTGLFVALSPPPLPAAAPRSCVCPPRPEVGARGCYSARVTVSSWWDEWDCEHAPTKMVLEGWLLLGGIPKCFGTPFEMELLV